MLYNCWRCGKVIDSDDGKPYYTLQAIEWKYSMGKTIGDVTICRKCADGVDGYLDEIYTKGKKKNGYRKNE